MPFSNSTPSSPTSASTVLTVRLTHLRQDPDRTERESLSSPQERRKRYVGRIERTNAAWQKNYCLGSTRSVNPPTMPCVPKARFLALSSFALALAVSFPALADAAPSSVATPAPTYAYADIADLALKAPMVIDATVRDVARIKGAEAVGVAPGRVRLYVTVGVVALIRGPGAVPSQIGYLYDAPLDSDGGVPRLKKQRVLLFARPVAGSPDQVQLVSNHAQLIWSAPAEATPRRLAAQITAAE